MKSMIVTLVCKVINCPSEHYGRVAIDFRFLFLGVSGKTFWYFLPSANGVAKVMFSVMSVCDSVSPSVQGPSPVSSHTWPWPWSPLYRVPAPTPLYTGLGAQFPPPPHTPSNLFTMKRGLSESRQLSFDLNAFLLPAANEVWSNLMFLHLSVILFTRGGGGWLPSMQHRSHNQHQDGWSASRGNLPMGRSASGGGICLQGKSAPWGGGEGDASRGSAYRRRGWADPPELEMLAVPILLECFLVKWNAAASHHLRYIGTCNLKLP